MLILESQVEIDTILVIAKLSSDDDLREKGAGKDAQTLNSPIHTVACMEGGHSFGRLQIDRRPASAEIEHRVHPTKCSSSASKLRMELNAAKVCGCSLSIPI